MNRVLVGAFLVLLLCQVVHGGEVTPAEARAALKKNVSLEFVDTPLSEALQFIQTMTKVTIILDPKASGDTRVTLKVTDMPLELALKQVAGLAGLNYSFRSSAVFIMNPPSPAAPPRQEKKAPSPPPPPKTDDADYWVEEMKKVHAKFTGEKGTFAQFGDSITVTMAFWAPLGWAHDKLDEPGKKAYEVVKAHMQQKCWRDWKGPEFGSQGSMTVKWAFDNVDAWLKKLNPEAALIMFGTNDVHGMDVTGHIRMLCEVINKCLANGTVVILSTIPPRHGFEGKVKQFVEAQKKLALELKVPLVDYYEEIIKRRPEDWDGALPRFAQFEGYEVPTLIARDGVHPSNPQKWQNDYSEEGLKNNGFTLRNYTTLLKYAEVIRRVLSPK